MRRSRTASTFAAFGLNCKRRHLGKSPRRDCLPRSSAQKGIATWPTPPKPNPRRKPVWTRQPLAKQERMIRGDPICHPQIPLNPCARDYSPSAPRLVILRKPLVHLRKRYAGREAAAWAGAGRPMPCARPPIWILIASMRQSRPAKLVRAAIADAAIIAYHQPTTRAKISKRSRSVWYRAGLWTSLLNLGLDPFCRR